MLFPSYSDQECEQILTLLSSSLREFVYKAGYSKVVLGLSGGIDSALVLAIAVDALGRDSVHSIFMPSAYTTQESKQCVRELSTNFHLEFSIFSIQDMFTSYCKAYENIFEYPLEGISLENIQSRMRANILMTYSNSKQALLLTTSNKSELSVGFCTLYGDTCGAIAPLGDVYKTLVYKLAKRTHVVYNNQMAMPEILFTKPPSAELAYKQCDEDRLPSYTILDEILYRVEHALSLSIDGDMEETIQYTIRLVEQARYKKLFYPPILSIADIV